MFNGLTNISRARGLMLIKLYYKPREEILRVHFAKRTFELQRGTLHEECLNEQL